jgi:hypothetical protein
MPVIGKNMISWFYAYVELIEIKAKTVNIIHFPYLDLSQNVKIRDVPYSSDCMFTIFLLNHSPYIIQCIVTGFKQIFMTPFLSLCDLDPDTISNDIIITSLKSPRNSECKLAHIYGMNKGKVFISCVLYTNGYVNVNG